MKTGIIDVGSNSVRLALTADGKTLYKRLATTRLGEGLSLSGKILPAAAERTARAVADFKLEAERDGAERVLCFATAAVRSAVNGAIFTDEVYRLCGLKVDVISGEEEALAGLYGALKGGDGGIIDVGGASTEVTVRTGGEIVFSQSVNIGTVRLLDLAGRDAEKLTAVINEKISEYGKFDASALDMYAIGGTATRLAAVRHGLREYRPEITDGTVVTRREVLDTADRLLSMSVEEIRATTICTKSADVVGGGCLLLGKVMEKFNISKITVSESDNLEGYLMLKGGAL